jgi:hypothetical protein
MVAVHKKSSGLVIELKQQRVLAVSDILWFMRAR